MELQKNLVAFVERGAEVWAISPDSASKLGLYAAKEGLELTLLSDEDMAVITEWGLINPENSKVPHPTAVIVDADGVIRYMRQDVDYKQRPSSAELLEVLDGIE